MKKKWLLGGDRGGAGWRAPAWPCAPACCKGRAARPWPGATRRQAKAGKDGKKPDVPLEFVAARGGAAGAGAPAAAGGVLRARWWRRRPPSCAPRPAARC